MTPSMFITVMLSVWILFHSNCSILSNNFNTANNKFSPIPQFYRFDGANLSIPPPVGIGIKEQAE
jgi:hypothetical protein